MPPVQKTFELVPTSLARPVARPPMTSKAAKKAYQKANNGGKITRAEQRRRDAEVLERLRKENEKERTAAKAKVAREKKAAKAAEEKLERKRRGVPEPRKGVRASQPTISLFVKGGNSVGFVNGKRGWQDVENAEDEDDMDDVTEPPMKKIAIEIQITSPRIIKQDVQDTPEKRFATNNQSRSPRGIKQDVPDTPKKKLATNNSIEPKVTRQNAPVPPTKKVMVQSQAKPKFTKQDMPVISTKDTNIQPAKAAVNSPRRNVSFEDKRRSNATATDPVKHFKAEKLAEPDPDSEDEFGDFPSLTQTDILERLDSPTHSFTEMPPPPFPLQRGSGIKPNIHIHKTLPRSPEKEKHLDEDEFGDDMASTQFFMEALSMPSPDEETPDYMSSYTHSAPTTVSSTRTDITSDVDEFDDGTALTQFFTEAIAVVSKIESRETTSVVTKKLSKDNPGFVGSSDAKVQCITPNTVSSTRRSALGERSINMPPPRLLVNSHKPTNIATPAFKARLIPQASRLVTPTDSPSTPKPKFIMDKKSSRPMGPPPQRPRFLPGNQNKENIHAGHPVPSATQVFLENNLDDFFPSPTQEQRELDEITDDADSLPSNTQIARDVSPSKPAVKTQAVLHDDFHFPSTQDFMISSQDLCDINTPKPSPVELLRISRSPSMAQSFLNEKRRFFKEKEDDLRKAGLITTAQRTKTARPGLIINAQTVSLSEDIRAGLGVAANTTSTSRPGLMTNAQTVSLSPDTRAMHAAIAESKELAELRRQANVIFEDDILEETKALEAVLAESKRLADLEAQRLEKELESRRFFQEKEDDMVEAAMWASKKPNAKKSHVAIQVQASGIPLQATSGVRSPVKTKRTLERVKSAVTDYGDDDFISSQEFLALCDRVDT